MSVCRKCRVATTTSNTPEVVCLACLNDFRKVEQRLKLAEDCIAAVQLRLKEPFGRDYVRLDALDAYFNAIRKADPVLLPCPFCGGKGQELHECADYPSKITYGCSHCEVASVAQTSGIPGTPHPLRDHTMNFNDVYTPGIVPLTPQGTNSTFFTECCETAICDNQAQCPSCKRNIIGHDAETQHARHQIRWRNATRHWPYRR